MDRFEGLNVFAAVADHRGFAAAGRVLGMSPPAVTRSVAMLERHLGVTLFHRSTRAVALTDDGAAFLDRARRVLADLRDAEHLVMGGRSTPQGQLFVTAPAMFGRLHVMPVIAALLGQYPGLSARLLLLDRNVRIIEEGIDVAVRIGQLADSALHTVAIGTVRQVIVASSSYLAARGTPLTPADLRNHDVIASTGIRVGNVWSFRQDAVSLSPRLSVNTIDATIAAAEAGLGLANLLSYQVADAVAAGRLVPVLEDQQAAAVPVSLLFERGRAAMPSARAFIAAMRARAAAGHWNPERS
jgi:DNA-binding transcriptional LysR family regulator